MLNVFLRPYVRKNKPGALLSFVFQCSGKQNTSIRMHARCAWLSAWCGALSVEAITSVPYSSTLRQMDGAEKPCSLWARWRLTTEAIAHDWTRVNQVLIWSELLRYRFQFTNLCICLQLYFESDTCKKLILGLGSNPSWNVSKSSNTIVASFVFVTDFNVAESSGTHIECI